MWYLLELQTTCFGPVIGPSSGLAWLRGGNYTVYCGQRDLGGGVIMSNIEITLRYRYYERISHLGKVTNTKYKIYTKAQNILLYITFVPFYIFLYFVFVTLPRCDILS